MKELAECGVFNISGYNSIDSAGRTNLYEAFNYLSAKKSEQEIIRKMNELK